MLLSLWLSHLAIRWFSGPFLLAMAGCGSWFLSQLILAMYGHDFFCAAGTICWDLLQTVGSLFTVWWLLSSCWSSREALLRLMDAYHPPLPPFRRYHTHRPAYFVEMKFGSRVGHRLAMFTDTVEDDGFDEFLAAELDWLQFRRFHWSRDWSLCDELFRWWLLGLSLLPRLMFQLLKTFKLFIVVFCWLLLHWLQCDASLLTDGWTDWATAAVSVPTVDELSLLLVASRDVLLAGLVLVGWFLWNLASFCLKLPPSFSRELPIKLRRNFGRWFRSSQDCSLEGLTTDLEALLGPTNSSPWDWTSLVLDLFGCEYSYLREDAFTFPPLPPALTVTSYLLVVLRMRALATWC